MHFSIFFSSNNVNCEKERERSSSIANYIVSRVVWSLPTLPRFTNSVIFPVSHRMYARNVLFILAVLGSERQIEASVKIKIVSKLRHSFSVKF
jgi:hypothetical protein